MQQRKNNLPITVVYFCWGYNIYFILSCATDNWLLNFVIETLCSFYAGTTIGILLIFLYELVSHEIAPLVMGVCCMMGGIVHRFFYCYPFVKI